MDEKKNGITIQKKHIVVAAIIILLLLIGGILVGANWNNWFGGDKQTDTTVSDPERSKPSLDIDPDAGKYTGELPKNSNGEDVGIKIPGYPSISLAKDTTSVKMALLNPEGNPCYFKFEIVLKENGETIYESKYVPPGDCIYDVTLAKPLSEGEHPATIKISTISLDGETPLNGANVETVLVAK